MNGFVKHPGIITFIALFIVFVVFSGSANGQPLFPNRIFNYPFDHNDHRSMVLDYNHDGYPDVVILHSYSLISWVWRLVVVINNGKGWIQEVRELAVFKSQQELNQGYEDGLPVPLLTPPVQFVQQAEGRQKTVIMDPLSWGTEENGRYISEMTLPLNIKAAVMLDWDGDGIDDLLAGIGSSYPYSLMILKGLPQGGFDVGTATEPGFELENTRNWPQRGRVATGDIDENGYMDTIEIDPTGNHFQAGPVFLTYTFGQPEGTSPIVQKQEVGRSEGSFDYILLYDFNGDSHLDLMRTVWGGVYLSLGNGDGTFEQQRYIRAGGGNFRLGDFNGDNIVDLLGTDYSPDTPVYNPSISISLGKGGGWFGDAMVYEVIYPSADRHPVWAMFTFPVRVGDANGDGLDDIWAGQGSEYEDVSQVPGVLWLSRGMQKSHAAVGEFLR